MRKREGQRSAARPRHICQTATGLAAALPFVNRGGESRGGMRETAGKERATTIAARSWWRSPRISSPLSFLRRLPTSPLSKPHLLQATGDRAGRANRHMGNAGPHTGERAAVEAPRGRIERAFVLMPIRGYSPHRLPQGQARQAAPWASDQIFRRLQTNLRIVLATPENLQQNFGSVNSFAQIGLQTLV